MASGKTAKLGASGEMSALIRRSLMEFARAATRDRGEIDLASKALGLSRSAIEKMKSTGRGSVESWLKLFIFHARLDEQAARQFFENFGDILARAKPATEIDALLEQLKVAFTPQELAAWAKLLLSKHKLESELGISVKASTSKLSSGGMKAAEGRVRVKKSAPRGE